MPVNAASGVIVWSSACPSAMQASIEIAPLAKALKIGAFQPVADVIAIAHVLHDNVADPPIRGALGLFDLLAGTGDDGNVAEGPTGDQARCRQRDFAEMQVRALG